ncbi:MAG: ABC transporter substrate-binding protein [candidate division NC10 bacterium]
MGQSRSRWALLALAVCGLALRPWPACAGTVKVNAVVNGVITDIIFYIGKEKKYFEKEGLEIYIVPMPVTGSVSSAQALANGTVDVAPLPFGANLLGLMRQSGIRIVGDYSRRVKGKPTTEYHLVRKDLASQIRTVADIKGRRVAMPTPAIWNYALFLRDLENAGLSEADFDGRAVSNSVLPSMLANKKLDVAVSVAEPLASRLIDMGLAQVLAGSDIAKESWPITQLCYSKRFMRDPQAGRRFMVAVLRSIRAFYRATPEELNAFAVKTWGMPVDPKALSKLDMVRDGRIDLQALAAAQDYALKKGWLKSKVDIKDLIDPSYIGYANDALRREE